jgi:hypothetical protein
MALKSLTAVIATLGTLVATIKGLSSEASAAPSSHKTSSAAAVTHTTTGAVNIRSNLPRDCLKNVWELCDQSHCGHTNPSYKCCGGCKVTADGTYKGDWPTRNTFLSAMIEYAERVEERGTPEEHVMGADGFVAWSDHHDESAIHWRVTCDDPRCSD